MSRYSYILHAADVDSLNAPAMWDAETVAALLTPAQREVAARVAQTNPEIARALHISTHTVRRHLQDAFARLGVRTRTQLALLLRDTGNR